MLTGKIPLFPPSPVFGGIGIDGRQSMKLMIVDDHILFREGLVSLFGNQPDIEVVGEAGSVNEALNRAPALKPDIILMDYSMPDGTGAEATRAILSKLPGCKVIFLTISEGDDQFLDAIRSGAKGYLLKNLSVNHLLASLRAVNRGEAVISPNMMTLLLDEVANSRNGTIHPRRSAYNMASTEGSQLPENLTTRELEVLEALAKGESNKQIASRLFIAENTVKNHVHSLFEKLNVRNRRDAVNFARKNGLIR
jgi:DNA-binding NarL/FixJ family response regulator